MCLIDHLYKIISKILAASLMNVVPRLTSTCQTAFVQNRQMLDGILVLNEIVDLANRQKKVCVAKGIFQKSL